MLLRISDVRFANTPAVLATVQVANIEASTTGRRAVELTKERADAVRESANGVNEALHHDVSAVAGTGPPFITDTHF
jgi:hypothetical protein